MFLAFFTTVSAQTNETISDAQTEGQKLAQTLEQSWPANNFTNIGVVKIREGHRKTVQLALTVRTIVESNAWDSWYQATDTNGIIIFKTVHQAGQSNGYFYQTNAALTEQAPTNVPSDLMVPFAGSDFWLADLGLEFFHWPAQTVLKKEMRRSRSCTVLESTNPLPQGQSYSRVVSWIDNESGGIVHAEAYDSHNKLLKEFDPKSFRKVHGQWELQEMEISNVQTGSRTRLEFDLTK